MTNLDIEKSSLISSGGPELLYGGNQYSVVSNWKNIKVIQVTETVMQLSVVRDQSSEGDAQRIYRYKVKPPAN